MNIPQRNSLTTDYWLFMNSEISKECSGARCLLMGRTDGHLVKKQMERDDTSSPKEHVDSTWVRPCRRLLHNRKSKWVGLEEHVHIRATKYNAAVRGCVGHCSILYSSHRSCSPLEISFAMDCASVTPATLTRTGWQMMNLIHTLQVIALKPLHGIFNDSMYFV